MFNGPNPGVWMTLLTLPAESVIAINEAPVPSSFSADPPAMILPSEVAEAKVNNVGPVKPFWVPLRFLATELTRAGERRPTRKNVVNSESRPSEVFP